MNEIMAYPLTLCAHALIGYDQSLPVEADL